ncbi:MAG: thioesterase family protein [Solirubrobacteraceae bacterium]|nr:thioesterase family protein [Solirubrobacteraceae bacterium]
MAFDTAFDRAIAAEPVHGAPGQYAVQFDADWNAPAGPNGGYLAALVLNAMSLALDDPIWQPRSLTLHFMRPPQPGAGTVAVATERAGRTMTTLSARVEQGGKTMVLALAAFGPPRPAVADFAQPAPDVPSVDELEPFPKHELMPPIAHRFDMHPLPGPEPFTGQGEAVVGGWMRLPEPRPVDALLLAIATDAWIPAVFFRITDPSAAPTIELTIHFRHVPAASEDSLLLTRFETQTSSEGFFEEDGWVWAPDGTLLAQSRQLALLIPLG